MPDSDGHSGPNGKSEVRRLVRIMPGRLMSLILTFCVTYSDTNVTNSEILHRLLPFNKPISGSRRRRDRRIRVVPRVARDSSSRRRIGHSTQRMSTLCVETNLGCNRTGYPMATPAVGYTHRHLGALRSDLNISYWKAQETCYIGLTLPRCEGDQEVTNTGSNWIDTARRGQRSRRVSHLRTAAVAGNFSSRSNSLRIFGSGVFMKSLSPA